LLTHFRRGSIEQRNDGHQAVARIANGKIKGIPVLAVFSVMVRGPQGQAQHTRRENVPYTPCNAGGLVDVSFVFHLCKLQNLWPQNPVGFAESSASFQLVY
jgi:hypothetical protein